MLYTLAREGHDYKGNLHTHTTCSDGDLTPEECKALYKKNGYSFLAITDHNRYGDFREMNEPGFLMVPGIEVDVWHGYGKPIDHVVGIGHPARNTLAHGEEFPHNASTAQELVDYLTSHGNEAIYAHPFWSYTPLDMLMELRGILGIEIINYSCEQEWKSGISEFYYEHLWQNRHDVFCFGSDDAHGHVPDFCGGYITVRAPELSYDALFAALKAGSFTASYARMGEDAPVIRDFIVEDGRAKLWCSPAMQVNLNIDRDHYYPTYAKDGEPVTYAECVLPDVAASVRAIVTDERRNLTWSQPILLG